MPTYEIEQFELHVQRHRIEATDEADAIARFVQGEGERMQNALTFVQIADEYGMSWSEKPDLCWQLLDRGILKHGDTSIPSICCICVVE